MMADLSKMKVIDLRRELRICGCKITGNKNALAERLQFAIKMNTNEPNLKSKQGAKKMKFGHHNDDANSKQSSAILEMPTEIIEYIFDYLDLEDLGAVSKTCKRMQQIACNCYQQNYSGLRPFFNKIDGHTGIRRFVYDSFICIDVEHFNPIFDKIKISPCRYNLPKKLLYKFIDLQSEFHQLKMLEIAMQDLTNFQIDSVKGILSKLEYLKFICCEMNDEFLGNLLSISPNIKRLSLNESRTGDMWLSRCYPTLEHCEISSEKFVPITIFLAHNPNVHKFGTKLGNLQRNMHLIKADQIKLEDLAVRVRDGHCADELKMHSFWKLLDEYRQLGIYKRLNLYYDLNSREFNQKFVDGITNFTTINRLCVASLKSDRVALSGLVDLEDISFSDSRYITDIETVATRLKNLKRIYFLKSNLSHVMLFMGANVKLQEIQIGWFMDEDNFEKQKVLNLIGLNKERAKLPNAKKITLLVKEPVYLATKRANRETDLEFIKLKRGESLNERNFDFEYPFLLRG